MMEPYKVVFTKFKKILHNCIVMNEGYLGIGQWLKIYHNGVLLHYFYKNEQV